MADQRPDRMSDADALLWALEANDPRMRSTITAAALLDRSPGAATVLHRVDRLTRLVPRFRQRVIEPIGGGLARWESDPDLDLAFHVRVVRAPQSGPAPAARGGRAGGAGEVPALLPPALLRMAEPFAAEALDRSRPPWQMLLVEDLAGGGAALLMKLHHTFTDGVGAAELATVLFGFQPEAASEPLAPTSRRPVAQPAEVLLDELGGEVSRTVQALRSAARWVSDDLRALAGDPRPAADGRVAFARSLASIASPASRPCSPVLAGRSTRCRFEALAVPLDDLRRAGKEAGGTVNDAFVAGVLGGLARYHHAHASHPGALRVAIPVSTRTGGDGTGNAFVPICIEAPLQIVDPVERMRAVHLLVAAGRSQPALGALPALAAVARRVPALRSALSAASAGIDVVASNVPGTDVPLYLGEARVDALVPFGPRSRSALNITVLSYRGMAGLGLNIDPAAAPDHAALRSALAEGLDEVVACGAPAATPPFAQPARPSTMER